MAWDWPWNPRIQIPDESPNSLRRRSNTRTLTGELDNADELPPMPTGSTFLNSIADALPTQSILDRAVNGQLSRGQPAAPAQSQTVSPNPGIDTQPMPTNPQEVYGENAPIIGVNKAVPSGIVIRKGDDQPGTPWSPAPMTPNDLYGMTRYLAAEARPGENVNLFTGARSEAPGWISPQVAASGIGALGHAYAAQQAAPADMLKAQAMMKDAEARADSSGSGSRLGKLADSIFTNVFNREIAAKQDYARAHQVATEETRRIYPSWSPEAGIAKPGTAPIASPINVASPKDVVVNPAAPKTDTMPAKLRAEILEAMIGPAGQPPRKTNALSLMDKLSRYDQQLKQYPNELRSLLMETVPSFGNRENMVSALHKQMFSDALASDLTDVGPYQIAPAPLTNQYFGQPGAGQPAYKVTGPAGEMTYQGNNSPLWSNAGDKASARDRAQKYAGLLGVLYGQ